MNGIILIQIKQLLSFCFHNKAETTKGLCLFVVIRESCSGSDDGSDRTIRSSLKISKINLIERIRIMSNETTKTSQSIFIILDSLETETSVPGQTPKMQRHTLPREMFPTSKQFESEEDLKNWAIGQGCLHAGLQKGIKSHLIDCRAKFKACKKGDTWSNEYGQDNLNAYKWEVMQRPNQGDTKKLVIKEVETLVKSIQTMLDLGLEIDVIKPKLLEKHNAEIVNMAIEMIE